MDNVPAVVLPAKFFTFDQNNTGGHFTFNDTLSAYVIIEAHTAEQANEIAERIGIYFDGCDDGSDCSCCGDRWSRAWEVEGKAQPLLYGEHPRNYTPLSFCSDINGVYCYTHYLNGVIQEYRVQSKDPALMDCLKV